MTTTLSLHVGASLQTTLSPRLQRAVRLLQMSSQDFAQELRGVLETNPFLEQDETPAEAAADIAPDEAPDAAFDDVAAPESWTLEGRSRLAAGEPDAVFDTLEARTSLADHLLGQVHVLPLGARDRMLAAAVIESLDDDGYLRTPPDEIGAALQLLPAATSAEMRIALRRVQSLDPAGVAARNVPECLTLQLHKVASPDTRALAAAILRDHIEALAARDTRSLARRLACMPAAIEAAIAASRRLDPHPGWRFAEPSVHYITPDVIARKVRGQWKAVLNEAIVPRVRLNRTYVELFQRFRDAQHGELGAHLQEARWTMRNMEQRFSTILGIAQAILKRQQHFLSYGSMAMKPLALRDIAAEVGVHESTVSRVTNNKFMATPCGVFELKYFFSRGMATSSGGSCSPTAIRGLVAEMIAEEPPGEPLSDVEIARQLAQQGLKVARRTVTKYRQALHIEPAERRRPPLALAA
jgi:RNA polymerase sigma-54 factor